MPAGPVDSEGGQSAECDQDPPDDVVRQVGGEESSREKWANDQAGGLHGEDEADEHAAVGFAGVLAHDGS
jgi:hypothetical protein